MSNSLLEGPLLPDFADFAGELARRLQKIYKASFSEGIVNRILAITNRRFPEQPAWSEQDIVLITYGNSIQKTDEAPLRTLHRFIGNRLYGTISCVHILPFFPFTSDDGFSVCDYMEVNASLGNWDDIKAFVPEFNLISDLVINHVSSEHPWFKNYLQNKSPGKDYFIEYEPGADYNKVVRPRSTPLFTPVETANGQKQVWTTFSADQIDLNFSNPEVLLEMIRVMVFYISQGVRIIRLDAIAYLWKQKGTSCLHQPETHEIVKLLRDIASFVCPGTLIMTETNVPNRENWSYFGENDEAHMVYQFSLPPLLLHALYSCNTNYLTEWAAEIPVTGSDQTFLNYTASHDGIGVRPLEGILPESEINELIQSMTDFGGLISRKVNTDGSLSPYEINITYYDALKGGKNGPDRLQEERFLCSQSIMLSLKGIPAFYIHSLLGTANDYKGVKTTGRARTINRRQFNEAEVNGMLSSGGIHSRVFNELVRLIGLRKKYAAFHPGSPQEILRVGSSFFAFIRYDRLTGEKIYCISNVTEKPTDFGPVLPGNKKGYDLISGKKYAPKDRILLKACQTIWMVEQDS